VKKIEAARGRLFRLGGIVAGLAAVAGLAVAGAAAASTRSPVASHGASGPRPTIVLVHGAWANGSSWDGVVQRLQEDGYTVDVPPNPLLLWLCCQQSHYTGVTEIVEIPNRGHALTIDSDGREVADTALAFTQRFTSLQPAGTGTASS
jgi:hypothetical protein